MCGDIISNIKEMINNSEELLFIGSVSFEERCLEFWRKIVFPFNEQKKILVLRIDDDRSHYSEECLQLTNNYYNDLEKLLNNTDRIERIDGCLSQSNTILNKIYSILQNINVESVFLDISTIPKKFFFPIIKYTLELKNLKNLFIIYTRPLKYSNNLSGDYEEVTPIPGFIGTYSGGKDNGWIPIFGVAGGLCKKIYLSKNFNDGKIFPIVAYPSIEVDNILFANKDIIDRLPKRYNDLNYSPPYDPFFTMKVIDTIIKNNPELFFILSPLGTKVQSLGCCLAALNYNLPVLYTQPQTYHPSYSIGIEQIYLYSLKKNNDTKLWEDSGKNTFQN